MFGFSALERHKIIELRQIIIILFVLEAEHKILRLGALPAVNMPKKIM